MLNQLNAEYCLSLRVCEPTAEWSGAVRGDGQITVFYNMVMKPLVQTDSYRGFIKLNCLESVHPKNQSYTFPFLLVFLFITLSNNYIILIRCVCRYVCFVLIFMELHYIQRVVSIRGN